MLRSRTFSRVVVLLVVFSLVIGAPAQVLAQDNTVYLPLVAGGNGTATTRPVGDLLFRTRVTVATTVQWRDLARLGVVFLDRGDDWALVLADDRQLEDLARWRYNPEGTDTVAALAAGNPALAAQVQPLLAVAAAVQERLVASAGGEGAANAATAEATAAREELRAEMQALSSAALASLAAAASVDTDADGLNDTLEGYWCTDPARPDSDFDTVNDGVEVAALKAWMSNNQLASLRAGPPSTGKPFQGWPPQKSNCFDDDLDSVPDVVESLELGLDPNQESTDRDKFDDGQELFGTTYCPGSGGFCGYGVRPRNEDWGVITAQMPSWVEAPGKHPLVAAYPVPRIELVPSTINVERMTIITTQLGEMEQKTNTYSESRTNGTSSSVADTETWNSWTEVSTTRPLARSADFVAAGSEPGQSVLEWRLGDFRLKIEPKIDLCIPIVKVFVDICAGELAFDPLVGESTDIEISPSLELPLDHDFDSPGLKDALKGCAIDSTGSLVCESVEPATDEKAAERDDPVVEMQDRNPGNSGYRYSSDNASNLSVQRVYQVTAPRPKSPTTRTETTGNAHGGAKTTTHTDYEEYTITDGEAFTTGRDWSTATAVNSALAADLRFTYKVRNAGTEYAREIGKLAFNIYIGDDANPACTYFLATGQCGNPGTGSGILFQNFMPNEEHPFTSSRIPLSLEQMKAIDLGGPIRIVVEDFTYGIDELFYQDAANAGVLVALEDGTADGDELIDTYLIPTWGQETVLNVLARYFPHRTDANGMLTAIWTPEYRSDTPAWCQEPQRPIDQPAKALWCKHELSTADWWNIYTDGLGNGAEGFQDTPAVPGAVALFRFNQDTDHDGFSDRSEARLGTDPNDASALPRPEVLAGVHNIVAGNKVTSTLSLLNTGLYDAYGVEAVMVAPDDSVSIVNNTVGGSGRVRAQQQVIVGSRIALQSPLPAPWTQTGHAVPAAGGYYTGNTDRTYTFTVANCPAGGCSVGSGTWRLDWNDGQGGSGSLNFGQGYASPTSLTVGVLGVSLALYSGSVQNGESFTIAARTPRDTFQYTINRTPYTAPLVIVSYNDPQGNHRFAVPAQAMNLAAPTVDLQVFAGQMLGDVGVEIVTAQPFAPGSNTAQLLVNNPTGTTLANAHLFLEVIDISGTVVSEVPTQVTLPPGPTYTPVTFSTGSFSPAYRAGEDYIVMAFLTDYQGNILDTAGRPLSSFQADPRPKLAVDEGTLTWNFGTAVQGALLKRPLALANVGHGALYTYVQPGNGLTLDRAGRTVGGADLSDYSLTLRTAGLPVGAYDRTVTIFTSDPSRPSLNLRVLGTIAAPSGDTAGGSSRPLDVAVTVQGPKSQGEWVEFTHTLGPEPQSLHPVKVYSQDYGMMYGVGKYATDFGQGTASYDMFGDGRDGMMPPSGNLDYDNGFGVGIVNSASIGATEINVTDAYAGWRINPGDAILIHQTQGNGAGCWEMNKAVSDYSGGTATIQLAKPIKCNYASGDNSHAQVLRVPQYSTCNVTGTITPLYAWNGSTGGIFAVICRDNLSISGTIHADGGDGATTSEGTPPGGTGGGFRGGQGDAVNNDNYGGGYSGDGTVGPGYWQGDGTLNGNGGGAGDGTPQRGNFGTGGGGGNGTPGGASTAGGIGQGGDAAGNPELTNMVFGGGGGGSNDNPGNSIGGGGAGGGAVILQASTISISGNVRAIGGQGGGNKWGAGGGAGGSILIRGKFVDIGASMILATGGAARSNGGAGGAGRVRIEYCESLMGTTNPPASTQKLNCYVTEQVESAPYTTGRLNLPESVTDTKTYRVQYGRKLNYVSASSQVITLRVRAGMLTAATLDALISQLPADASFALDVGADGSNDWTATAANNSTNASPNLAAAFNAWWASHGAPTTGTLDVPVKVTLGQAGQVLLANLQVTTAGSKQRAVRLPVQSYTTFNLDFTLGGSGGPVTVALDVGANGSIDWNGSAASLPFAFKTGSLAAAINAFLTGKGGEVDVPLRFFVAPNADVTLTDYQATAPPAVDLAAASIGLGAALSAASTAAYREGDQITLQAVLNNPSGKDSGPLTAAFFAAAPGWGDWYVGSAFVPNIAAGGSAQVSTLWDTTGFGSATPVPVKVVVNPYGRTPESNLDNNVKTMSVAVAPIQTSQTITFGPLANRLLGEPAFVISATASSGLAVNFASLTPAVCTVSGNTVTLVATGVCTIQATQPGNAFFSAAASKSQSFTVRSATKTDQTITFPVLPDRTLGDPPFTVSATASSGLAVSFASRTQAVCTVSGNTVTLVAAGTCTIRATQAGNATYNPAPAVDRSFTVAAPVVKQNQAIAFVPPADTTLGAAPFALAATASSGLPVSFTSMTTGICTVSGDTVTLVAAGTCTIRATQAGNATYNPALPVEHSFTVAAAPVVKQDQTVTFDPLADKVLGDAAFTLAASASSGLAVSFASSTKAICTVSGNTVTLVAEGTCTITAIQAGNHAYKPAPAVTRSFVVHPRAEAPEHRLYLPVLAR